VSEGAGEDARDDRGSLRDDDVSEVECPRVRGLTRG